MPVLLVGAYLPEGRYISSAVNHQVTRNIARRVEEFLESQASQLEDVSIYPSTISRASSVRKATQISGFSNKSTPPT